jgi:hypothetical protein
MADFRQVLDFCELRDIDFCGVPWTYVNRKDGPRNVKVRLDGGGATQEWIDLFLMLLLLTSRRPALAIAPSCCGCKKRIVIT